jgi:hypothetical protein
MSGEGIHVRTAQRVPLGFAMKTDETDYRTIFSSAYGTAFALELRERRALGIELSPEMVASVAHEATTVARGAVQGWKQIAAAGEVRRG